VWYGCEIWCLTWRENICWGRSKMGYEENKTLPNYAISNLHIFLWKEKLKYWRAELFLAWMKAQWEEIGGRILLGNNTGGWSISLGPIRFHCFKVRISTELPCTFGHICNLLRLVPDLPGRYNCLSWKVSVGGAKKHEAAWGCP